jgi:tetratricopeptide (TPR) repeat protein
MAGPKKKSTKKGGGGHSHAAGMPGEPPQEQPRIVIASPFCPPTPMPSERMMFDLAHSIQSEEPDPLEGVERADDPRRKAQRLMYEAWEKPLEDGIELADQALEIDPDCADALLFKSLEAGVRGEIDSALALIFEAMEAGERSLADTGLLDESDGCLWGYLPARPYLRTQYYLARLLWDMGSRLAAVAMAERSLELDQNDSLGARFLLLSWLLDIGERTFTRELLDDYEKDDSALFLYGNALLTFWEEGATNTSRARLRKAFKANPFVPDLVLESDFFEESDLMEASLYSPGDENEGLICAAMLLVAWDRDLEATDWLADLWEKYRKR